MSTKRNLRNSRSPLPALSSSPSRSPLDSCPISLFRSYSLVTIPSTPWLFKYCALSDLSFSSPQQKRARPACFTSDITEGSRNKSSEFTLIPTSCSALANLMAAWMDSVLRDLLYCSKDKLTDAPHSFTIHFASFP